jgi:hypothetical protein
MKTILSTLLSLLWLFVAAQGDSKTVQWIENIPLEADQFIGYDKFEYLYFVKSNVLHKVKNNESLAYKNLALGQISKVDLLNPLKVIVLYERFNTAITLDNQLNETLKIDFSQLKTPLVVSKIGIASQNQLWVFDDISRQLYLYNTINGTLKAVGTPLSENIVYYNSDFNNFEWLDDKNNWYQCNIFGMIQKLDYYIDFDKVLFSDSEYIIYKKDEKVFAFAKNTNTYILLENSNKMVESLSYKNQILSIFTKREISNFKIKIP